MLNLGHKALLRLERHIAAAMIVLVGSTSLLACNGAEADVSVMTRIHGVWENQVERLSDSALVRVSYEDGQECVEVTVSMLARQVESTGDATGNGGKFCGVRRSEDSVWHGLSGGNVYVPPSYRNRGVQDAMAHGDLIYGVGPPGLGAVIVTKNDVDLVVHTDERAGMAVFVVWWRGSGNPGGAIPKVSVRPAP